MNNTSRPRRATIADVAREAGVSRTTVSHALNDLGKVNPQTRERIKEVAAQLNYRPSVRAQGLRYGRSHTVALLSSMPSEVSAGSSQLGFFMELAMGCSRHALLRGYAFVLVPPMADGDPLDRLDIDGAILLEPLPGDPMTAALTSQGIPFVTIDGNDGPREVTLRPTETADLMLEHLHGQGSTAPALVISDSDRTAQSAALSRYLERAETFGFTPHVARVAESEGEHGGYRATSSLLAAHPEIDALCVPIDAFATGAVEAGQANGRTIGEDLLVATRYDGLRARSATPQLTAVDLHLEQISQLAVAKLLSLIANGGEQDGPPAEDSAPYPSLVPRASTRAGRE